MTVLNRTHRCPALKSVFFLLCLAAAAPLCAQTSATPTLASKPGWIHRLFSSSSKPPAPSATTQETAASVPSTPSPQPAASLPVAPTPVSAVETPAPQAAATQTPAIQAPTLPAAQQPGTQSAQDQPTETIKVQVNEVNLIFTVTDKKGKFITGLKRENFGLLDDGRPPLAVLRFTQQTNLPLRVGIMLDT
ncbi:MAG: hypothetical protein ACRD3K_07350, partial [Edaphobacter sp.]